MLSSNAYFDFHTPANVLGEIRGQIEATPFTHGDVTDGKDKAVACTACHGTNGVSSSPIYPNLAGQHEQYLVNAMKAYNTGDRSDSTMQAMVASLSDADIANLAANFASLSCDVGATPFIGVTP